MVHIPRLGVTKLNAPLRSHDRLAFLPAAKPFTRLRRLWRIKGSGGPPVRGMSRSDKGCAGSGEDGKTTSEQEDIYAVAVRDNCFSGVEDRGEPPRYTRMTGSCFCFAKPLCRYAYHSGATLTQGRLGQRKALLFRRYADTGMALERRIFFDRTPSLCFYKKKTSPFGRGL